MKKKNIFEILFILSEFTTIYDSPIEHLCDLVPLPLFLYLVPYLHQFSAVEYIGAENGIVFGANFAFGLGYVITF